MKTNFNLSQKEQEILNIFLRESESVVMKKIFSNNNTVLGLQMKWQPKEDITAYELALCLPYLFESIHNPSMSFEIDKTLPHFRHFEIINNNK